MKVLNTIEAAAIIGKTPGALRNSYKKWGVPHFRLGGQIKYLEEKLVEWLLQKTETSTQDDQAAVDRRAARRLAKETREQHEVTQIERKLSKQRSNGRR